MFVIVTTCKPELHITMNIACTVAGSDNYIEAYDI